MAKVMVNKFYCKPQNSKCLNLQPFVHAIATYAPEPCAKTYK